MTRASSDRRNSRNRVTTAIAQVVVRAFSCEGVMPPRKSTRGAQRKHWRLRGKASKVLRLRGALSEAVLATCARGWSQEVCATPELTRFAARRREPNQESR